MKEQKHSISSKDQHFYVGIDVHKKRWVITIRHNGLSLKTFSMDPYPEQLKKYLESHYPEGIFHIVYEIDFCGFWIYRKFKQLGLNCIVVNPADIPTAQKEKDRKTDSIDSHKLARELEKGELQPLYVPTGQIQHLRALTKLYHRPVQSTTRFKDRIRQICSWQRVDSILLSENM